MKLKFFLPFREGEVLATWGQAQLIRYLGGKAELRGGSEKDQAEAREWMSILCREAIVGDRSGRRISEPESKQSVLKRA